jgi:hypothetical protein
VSKHALRLLLALNFTSCNFLPLAFLMAAVRPSLDKILDQDDPNTIERVVARYLNSSIKTCSLPFKIKYFTI